MQVTLYRDHPAEGWPSMDRYAESLSAALQQLAVSGWEFKMPMPPPPWPGRYGQVLRRSLGYRAWARQEQGNVNHILDHSYGHLLLTLDPMRTVMTVHDVTPLRFPGYRFGFSQLAWRLAWRGVQRAQHVIVVSSFIAAELQDCLKLPARRIFIVPEGVSPHFCPQPAARQTAVRSKYVVEGQPFVLHVGHTHPRKNLPTLLRAMALLRQKGMSLAFVQIGGRPSDTHTRLIHELGLEQAIHFVGRIPDADLVALYSAAAVFVFPSLYEGFGLPVLEAMACGTPVVASNAASLPEVVGDAGLLVAPDSPQALAEAIAQVLDDQALAAELRQRGLERARRSTWEQTARGCLNVYRHVGENDR
jgi:glycosyltransferase involved in cell wall biosynthesis